MHDLVYAVRFLAKRRAFTAVALVVMALGISLTATVYAIIEGVILDGPDYRDFDRIVQIRTTVPQATFLQSVRIHDYVDWREGQNAFQEMGAWLWWSVTLSGDDDRAQRFNGARVTASIFDLLGVEPILGRRFTPADDLVEGVDEVVLSYDLWQNRYEGDPAIIGRSLRLNARPTTVIGVMPPGFRFPETHDMWTPLGVDPARYDRGTGPGLQVIATPLAGLERDEASARMRALGERLTLQYPEANRDIIPVLESWRDIAFVDAELRGILYTMFVAVVGVLLIACSNVANLLFALTLARGKELAVRTAMGADRWRVLRQLLLESVVLSLAGALLGMGLSFVSLKAFTRAVTPLNPPSWIRFELSPTVVLFAVGVSFVAALAAGLLPALQATRADVAGVLRDQGRGTTSRSVHRWSTGLVGLEVAVSCALLIAAGLLVRTNLAVGNADYGVDAERVLTASTTASSESYPDSASRILLQDRMVERLAALPDAGGAALASALPGLGGGTSWYQLQGRSYATDRDYPFAVWTAVTPGFFDVLGVEFVRGRGFTSGDGPGSERVVVVDERFVERNWPDRDPLGQQVRLGRSDSRDAWMTVVGVVPDILMTRPDNYGGRPPEGMYVPLAQHPRSGYNLLVRTDGDPLALAGPFRQAVAGVDLDLPVEWLDTLENRQQDALLQFVILGWMFSIFGVVALVLAATGLYAVMSFSVSSRRTEVGVRMALGAEPAGIVRMILIQGSRPLAAGILVGLILAVLLGKALESQLFGVTATDPGTFGGVPLLLALVSLTALLLPALRASRVAPVVALRDD